MEKKRQKKEYIITYRSQEHYEVLGWVIASSMKEAKKRAQKELLKKVRRYNVVEAKIAEWKNSENILFDI